MTPGHRRPALAVHGALSRGAFAVAVLVSLAVLFAPGDQVPTALPGVDVAVHLVVFAVLAVTGRWAGVGALALVGGLVLYAAASEVVQAVSPLNRSGSVTDLLADVVGVLLGTAAWSVLSRRPRGGS